MTYGTLGALALRTRDGGLKDLLQYYHIHYMDHPSLSIISGAEIPAAAAFEVDVPLVECAKTQSHSPLTLPLSILQWNIIELACAA